MKKAAVLALALAFAMRLPCGAAVLSPAAPRPFPSPRSVQEQAPVIIAGRIIDKETKDPLPAYVLAEDGRGVSADGQGRFRLSVTGKAGAPVKLQVFLIGYRTAELTVRAGDMALSIALDLAPLPAREISVTADSGLTDAKNARTIKLDKMDVYTLPGTAADPILAAEVLPGVNALPDTSSLLIRGGAPDEVAYFFDGIEIPHPFLSESLHESYFSIFDNQIVRSFSVATGGYAPRYGNALSGVMDLTAKDSPPKGEGGIGLSVMGLNSYVGLPVGGRGSLIASYSRSDSGLLTALNGRRGNRFGSENAFAKAGLDLGNGHQLRFYGLSDTYDFYRSGEFGVGSGNVMAAATWTAAWTNKFATKAVAAWTRYSVDYREAGGAAGAGTADAGTGAGTDGTAPAATTAATRDAALQARFDAMWDLDRHYLEFGADALGRRLETTVGSGAAAAAGAPDDAAGDVYASRLRATRVGLYFNDKFRLSDRLYLNAGARAAGYDGGARAWAFDPRLSVVYLAGKSDALRFSTGIYHQFGDAAVLFAHPALEPKSATHFALSFDRVRDDLDLRATVYDKEYRRLFLTGADGAVTNSGRGYARGAEIFLKKKLKAFEVLGVYNFLTSKRMEGDVRALVPSPYEVAHSATAIVRWLFKGGSLGVRYSFASGRPYTPLAAIAYMGQDETGGAAAGGALAAEAATLAWGDPFSARYPDFRRLDINGTANLKAFGRMLVLYFGVTNVFDDVNILRYDYSPVTGERADQQSIFGRTLFVGAYVPFF
jgi:hypothetical protein